MNRYLWDGSYTVEAAFIVPMVLGILYAWMFHLFYLHDQVVMDGMLQELVVQWPEDDWEDDQRTQEWRKQIQNDLWIAKIDKIEIQQNKLRTKGTISASAAWRIPVMEMFMGNCFTSSITQNVSNVRAEEVLRIHGKEEKENGGAGRE